METSTSSSAASTSNAAGSSTPKQKSQMSEWHFLQCFGERAPGEDVQEADIISAVEFNFDGQRLATGDRGGRVVLFEQADAQPRMVDLDERPSPPGKFANLEYRYLTEFQSHDPEFDYLKSMEIEEKINQVKWVDRNTQSQFILSTNDKTVKLWRVYDRFSAEVAATFSVAGSDDDWTIPAYDPSIGGVNAKISISPSKKGDIVEKWNEPITPITTAASNAFQLPQLNIKNKGPAARLSRLYANAHTYHINSVSMSSDQETFMSADDLRINLWNLEITDCAFNILDLKPANMEDLAEVITCAEFHPEHCNIFAYSTSMGDIKMADMRAQALCDKHVKEFGSSTDGGSPRSAYAEIIGSISDMRFCRDGRHMISRDYMSIKLWDINMESKPVAIIPMHEHLRSRGRLEAYIQFLETFDVEQDPTNVFDPGTKKEDFFRFVSTAVCFMSFGREHAGTAPLPRFPELYDNNGMFDKFDCCISGDGKQIASGTYGNQMKIVQQDGAWPEQSFTILEASRDPLRRRQFAPKTASRFGLHRNIKRPPVQQNTFAEPDEKDFNTKLMHLAWNPVRPVIAAAAANSLYLYCQQ